LPKIGIAIPAFFPKEESIVTVQPTLFLKERVDQNSKLYLSN